MEELRYFYFIKELIILKSMLVKWSDEYSVGIKAIDEQHKKFFAIINKLNDAIDKREMKEGLFEILNELKEYANFHFGFEEKYFKEFNYDGAEAHKKVHDAFDAKINDYLKKYKNNEIEVSFELIDLMENWLINHINDVDRKYIKCFHEHGMF